EDLRGFVISRDVGRIEKSREQRAKSRRRSRDLIAHAQIEAICLLLSALCSLLSAPHEPSDSSFVPTATSGALTGYSPALRLGTFDRAAMTCPPPVAISRDADVPHPHPLDAAKAKGSLAHA